MSSAEALPEASRPRSLSQTSSQSFQTANDHSRSEVLVDGRSDISSPNQPPSVLTLSSESDDELILVPQLSSLDGRSLTSTYDGVVSIGSPSEGNSSFDMLSSLGSPVNEDDVLSQDYDSDEREDKDSDSDEDLARAHQRALRELDDDENDESSSSASSAEDEVVYQGEETPAQVVSSSVGTYLVQRLAGLMIHTPASVSTPRDTVTPTPALIFPPAPSTTVVNSSTSKKEKKKDKRRRAKQRKQERKRQQRLGLALSASTGSIDDDSDEYHAAVAHVSAYLNNPPTKPTPVERLRFYQAIIIELGIMENGKTPLPTSCKAAKTILKAQVHVNVKDYLAARLRPAEGISPVASPASAPSTDDNLTKNQRRALRRKMKTQSVSTVSSQSTAEGVGVGIEELRKIMYPSKAALVKSFRTNKKAIVPRKQIKTMGLDVLMVNIFH